MQLGHTISSYGVEHGTSIEMCAYGRGGMLRASNVSSATDLNHGSNVRDYHGGGEKSDKPAAANEGRLQRFEATKANKVSICNAPFEKELLSGKTPIKILVKAAQQGTPAMAKGSISETHKNAIEGNLQKFMKTDCIRYDTNAGTADEPSSGLSQHGKRTLQEADQDALRIETSAHTANDCGPTLKFLSSAKACKSLELMQGRFEEVAEWTEELPAGTGELRFAEYFNGEITYGIHSSPCVTHHNGNQHTVNLQLAGYTWILVAHPETFQDDCYKGNVGTDSERYGARPFDDSTRPDQWLITVMQAGDILYIPPEWWHTVVSSSYSLMISIRQPISDTYFQMGNVNYLQDEHRLANHCTRSYLQKLSEEKQILWHRAITSWWVVSRHDGYIAVHLLDQNSWETLHKLGYLLTGFGEGWDAKYRAILHQSLTSTQLRMLTFKPAEGTPPDEHATHDDRGHDDGMPVESWHSIFYASSDSEHVPSPPSSPPDTEVSPAQQLTFPLSFSGSKPLILRFGHWMVLIDQCWRRINGLTGGIYEGHTIDVNPIYIHASYAHKEKVQVPITIGMSSAARSLACRAQLTDNIHEIYASRQGICVFCHTYLDFKNLRWVPAIPGDTRGSKMCATAYANPNRQQVCHNSAQCTNCGVDAVLPISTLPEDRREHRTLLRWCSRDLFSTRWRVTWIARRELQRAGRYILFGLRLVRLLAESNALRYTPGGIGEGEAATEFANYVDEHPANNGEGLLAVNIITQAMLQNYRDEYASPPHSPPSMEQPGPTMDNKNLAIFLRDSSFEDCVTVTHVIDVIAEASLPLRAGPLYILCAFLFLPPHVAFDDDCTGLTGIVKRFADLESYLATITPLGSQLLVCEYSPMDQDGQIISPRYPAEGRVLRGRRLASPSKYLWYGEELEELWEEEEGALHNARRIFIGLCAWYGRVRLRLKRRRRLLSTSTFALPIKTTSPPPSPPGPTLSKLAVPTSELYTKSIGIHWSAVQEKVLTTLGLSPSKTPTKTDPETHQQMQQPFMITGDMLSDLTPAERSFVSINHQDFAINHAAKGCLLRTTTAIEILPNEVMTHYVPIPDRMDSFRYYLVRNAPGRLQAINQGLKHTLLVQEVITVRTAVATSPPYKWELAVTLLNRSTTSTRLTRGSIMAIGLATSHDGRSISPELFRDISCSPSVPPSPPDLAAGDPQQKPISLPYILQSCATIIGATQAQVSRVSTDCFGAIMTQLNALPGITNQLVATKPTCYSEVSPSEMQRMGFELRTTVQPSDHHLPSPPGSPPETTPSDLTTEHLTTPSSSTTPESPGLETTPRQTNSEIMATLLIVASQANTERLKNQLRQVIGEWRNTIAKSLLVKRVYQRLIDRGFTETVVLRNAFISWLAGVTTVHESSLIKDGLSTSAVRRVRFGQATPPQLTDSTTIADEDGSKVMGLMTRLDSQLNSSVTLIRESQLEMKARLAECQRRCEVTEHRISEHASRQYDDRSHIAKTLEEHIAQMREGVVEMVSDLRNELFATTTHMVSSKLMNERRLGLPGTNTPSRFTEGNHSSLNVPEDADSQKRLAIWILDSIAEAQGMSMLMERSFMPFFTLEEDALATLRTSATGVMTILPVPSQCSERTALLMIQDYISEANIERPGCNVRVLNPLTFPKCWLNQLRQAQPALKDRHLIGEPSILMVIIRHSRADLDASAVNAHLRMLNTLTERVRIRELYLVARLDEAQRKSDDDDERTVIAMIASQYKTGTRRPIRDAEPDDRTNTTPNLEKPESIRLGHIFSVELSGAMPKWTDEPAVQSFHLKLVRYLQTSAGRDILRALLHRVDCDCVSQLSDAVLHQISISTRAMPLMNLYQMQASQDELHRACQRWEGWMRENFSLPLTNRAPPPKEILEGLMFAFYDILLLQRAIPHGSGSDAQARHEASRQCNRPRRNGISDAIWIKEVIDSLSGLLTLWGPSHSDILIKSELPGIFTHMVNEMTDPMMKQQVMRLAEDFIVGLAKSKGVSVEELYEDSIQKRETSFSSRRQGPAHVDGAVLLTGTHSNAVLKFFRSPHDLRKIVEMGQLQSFLLMLARDIVGRHLGSVIDDKTGKIMNDAVLMVVPDPATGNAVSEWYPTLQNHHENMTAAVQDEKRLGEQLQLLTDNMAKFTQGLRDQQAADTACLTKQIDSVAQHTELRKHSGMDWQPSGVQAVGANPPNRNRTSWNRNSTSQPDSRNERPRFPRPPRKDKDGNIIWRLTDKPATKWGDIPDWFKSMLAGFGIQHDEDWTARAEKVCLLCGPNADHWWSRCVKVWASTDAGQKYLGAAKASQRVQEAMKAKAPSTATSTIEDVTLCVGCTLEATRDSSMEASSLVNWVCEGMGLSQEDDGSMFYEAIDYITQEQDMLQSELQK